jgi:hypothetical protein
MTVTPPVAFNFYFLQTISRGEMPLDKKFAFARGSI